MKAARFIIFPIVLVLALFVLNSSAQARGVKNIFPQSTQSWLNGGARLTENKDADTPLNNPAGAAGMNDGCHLHLSGFYLYDKTLLINEETGKEYQRRVHAPIPYFAGTYKKDNWAVFLTFSVPGGSGGGKLGDNGVPQFDYIAQGLSQQLGTNVSAQSQSMKYGGGTFAVTLGSALQITEKLSIGGGVKYAIYQGFADGYADFIVDANGQRIGAVAIDSSTEGTGVGYVLSANYAITPKFTLGLRYDSKVSIVAKTKVGLCDNSGVINDTESHEDLPASIAIGTRYQITDKTSINGLFAYFLQQGVDASPGKIETDRWQNGYDISMSVNHLVIDKLNLICSLQYEKVGWTKSTYGVTQALDTASEHLAIALGAEYRLNKNFKFIGGLGTYFPLKTDRTPNDPVGQHKRKHKTAYVGTAGIEFRW